MRAVQQQRLLFDHGRLSLVEDATAGAQHRAAIGCRVGQRKAGRQIVGVVDTRQFVAKPNQQAKPGPETDLILEEIGGLISRECDSRIAQVYRVEEGPVVDEARQVGK